MEEEAPKVFRAKRNRTQPDTFYNGIKNRDLTQEEYTALDAEQRKIVRKSGLWDYLTMEEYRAEVADATGAIPEGDDTEDEDDDASAESAELIPAEPDGGPEPDSDADVPFPDPFAPPADSPGFAFGGNR